MTATELKTSSTLITPTPTWSAVTVTHTPPPSPPKTQHRLGGGGGLSPILPSIWPKVEQIRKVDPRTGLEHADVLEIDRGTTQMAAKDKLDRLKQAYGIFFANSAQRSANRFSGFGQRNAAAENPIFVPSRQQQQQQQKRKQAGGEGDLDYDYIEEFDQQGLAAQDRPVFVADPKKRGRNRVATPALKKPSVGSSSSGRRRNPVIPRVAAAPSARVEPIEASEASPSTKVFTLFFSGRVPGDYTTRLTTLAVDSSGQPLRSKRSAEIEPSPVIPPIMMTEPPSLNDVALADDQLVFEEEELASPSTTRQDCAELILELQSSIQTVTVTKVVTVTETVGSSEEVN